MSHVTSVDPVEELRVRIDLVDLYAEYASALDDNRLDDWLGLFVEDASYRIVSRENWDRGLPLMTVWCESRAAMQDRARAIRETQMFTSRWLRHLVGPVRVTSAGPPPLDVEASYAVFETLPDEQTRVLSVGRYSDRIVRDADGTLRFADKVCVYDSVLIPTSLVYPL